MQPKIARRELLFSLLSLGPGALGCRRPASNSQVSSFEHEGAHLRVACPNVTIQALFRQQAGPWATRQGVKLEPVPASQVSPDRTGADIEVVDPADLPRAVSAGLVAEVPESYQRREDPYGWVELLALYREQLLRWEGRAWGLPVLGESPLCCYRSDWLQDPAHQEAFRRQHGRPLEPPRTWQHFLDIAEYFQAHPAARGKAGPSLPPLPADDAALDSLFYTVAASYARHALSGGSNSRELSRADLFAFHYDLKSGQPRIAGPGFVQALALLQRLQKCRPTEAHARPEEAFAAGQAVLCLTSAGWLAHFQRQRALRDRVSLCRIPGAPAYFDFQTGAKHRVAEGNYVPYLGGQGWLAVVRKASTHPETAFALLAALTGPTTSTETALEPRWGGGPVREDQLLRDRWDAFDLDTHQTRQLRDVLQTELIHRSVKNPVLCLRIPTAREHRAVLVQAVRAALQEGSDPERALRGVARRWSEMDQARGLAKHQEEYRLSLGLLAR